MKKFLWVPGAVATTLFLLHFFGAAGFSLAGSDFRFALQISPRGITEISFPPVGKIAAQTHLSPLKLTLTLEGIDPDQLVSLLASPDYQALMEQEVKKAFQQVLFYFLVLAALGGLLPFLLFPKRQWRTYLGGTLTGLFTFLFLSAGVYVTYNPAAFLNPTYTGFLKTTPQIFSLAQKAVTNNQSLESQAHNLTLHLTHFFTQLNSLPSHQALAKSTHILHISDLHSNPLAYTFLKEILANFRVDVVVDTGDLSELGTPLEVTLTQNLQEIKVPYFFVPGNHDSLSVLHALQKFPQVKVLTEGKVREIAKIKFLGLQSPEEFQGLSKLQPDVIALHDCYAAEELFGEAPVILCGHSHRQEIKNEAGTILVNAGTSGAAGGRGLVEGEVPYTFAFLYFQPPSTHQRAKLLAVDLLTIEQPSFCFHLERKFFN